MIISGFIIYLNINNPAACTTIAHSHAMAHCIKTMPEAHFTPSSRLIDAIAAIHGVYNRQKTSSEAAAIGSIAAISASVEPNNTERVDTTLSLAINPEIRAVEILQSPNPIGAKIGDMKPAIIASILSCESVTMLRCLSNVCKNQMIMAAINITVKALWIKSFALSHNN